jgi:hypothetical protein
MRCTAPFRCGLRATSLWLARGHSGVVSQSTENKKKNQRSQRSLSGRFGEPSGYFPMHDPEMTSFKR